MRILVVDNQTRTRQSLKALLTAWYQIQEVSEAGNGYEAIQKVETDQPDVILMDLRMPKMDGLEAIRLIKAKSPQIKIVALSMYPDKEIEALAAGADAFVSKSNPPDHLRKTLARIILEE